MFEFTIGCDPEVFITDKKGTPVSAHDLLPGTKENPHPVPHGAVQVDGTAGEFNTEPVALDGTPTNAGTFSRTVESVMGTLSEMVVAKNPYLKLNISSVQEYSEEYLKTLPQEATELGCNPDYNAYTLEPNPTPDASVSFRTASGHIHVGWGADIPTDSPEHIEICANFIKTMDWVVGLYMTLIETDNRRRDLYGKAGAFRPKSYGVEYRTPSSVWLQSETRRLSIYYLTQTAVSMAKNGATPSLTIGATQDEVVQVINEGDWKTAYELLSMLMDAVFLPGVVQNSIKSEYNIRIEMEKPKLKGHKVLIAEAETKKQKPKVTPKTTGHAIKMTYPWPERFANEFVAGDAHIERI